jgi:hypothetical protein
MSTSRCSSSSSMPSRSRRVPASGSAAASTTAALQPPIVTDSADSRTESLPVPRSPDTTTGTLPASDARADAASSRQVRLRPTRPGRSASPSPCLDRRARASAGCASNSMTAPNTWTPSSTGRSRAAISSPSASASVAMLVPAALCALEARSHNAAWSRPSRTFAAAGFVITS